MKILRTKLAQGGSTLLLTVVATGIIGLMLAAYLSLVKVQNISGFRSQAWNATIPVIEAGIEEALCHLNAHGSNGPLGGIDGWTGPVSITLSDGSHSGYIVNRSVGDNSYNVFIYNWIPGGTNQFPVIESRGFVNTPVMVASLNGSKNNYMFAATVNTPPPKLARGVRAVTTQNFYFTKALAANGVIDLGGNNIKTDSFDSTDPAYNTNGKYDPTKAKANGDIATNDTMTNSVNVGNADVYGKVSTGPSGTVYVGPQGSVGDMAWHTAGTKGLETGYVTDDMNVQFEPVDTPSTSGTFAPASGSVGGTNYTYVLSTASGPNYWYHGNMSLGGNDQILVTGNTTLYVDGSFSMSGQSSITIAPGASLTLYIGGPSASIGGNGVANAGNATTFMVYGLPTCTSMSVNGNGAFTGSLYAPNADLTLNGGGTNNQNNPDDFVGAAVAKSVKMTGHFNFHYDEALRKRGPWKGYIITSWNEMNPADVAIVPR